MTSKKNIIIATLLSLLPIVVGLLLWDKLPAEIPTRFDINGVAVNHSSKMLAVIILPAILAGVVLLVGFMTANDPKQKNINNKMMNVGIFAIPVVSNVMNICICMMALGYSVDITTITFIGIGILFMVIGNYLPKTKQNYTVGIKVPWALNSTDNWNKTHRLGSRLFILAGLLIIVDAWFKSFILLIIAILIVTIVPIAYSYILYKKGI